MADTQSSDSLADCPLESLIEDEARKRLCGGKILLRIRLAGDEVASLKDPPPLFCLAPRLSYLPLFFNEAYEHFKPFIEPRMGQSYEIWFDFNNVPLRWQFPIGVLCDILCGLEVPLPWELTAHFRGSTDQELVPFSGLADLQQAVMSSYRQAVFLQQGSSAPFMRLPKQQQTQLWDAVSKIDLEACTSVHKQLLCPSLSRCKSLAIRLHFYGPPHLMLLHPAPALEEDKAGEPATLRSWLRKTVPVLLDGGGEELADGVEVLSQGVRIPLDTPLYWMALNTAYLDQFIHLVARVPPQLLSLSGSGDTV